MKKYIFLLTVIMLGVFTACDYNDKNFPGYDDMSKPTNTSQYEYTIVNSDYATIIKGLLGNKNKADSVMAAQLESDKMFSNLAPAADLIPYALTSLYYSVDKGASANVTYQVKENRTTALGKLSTPNYTLTESHYQSVWGKEYVLALTPEKAPGVEIPKILTTDFPNAEEGDFKNVDFYYSEEEPVYDMVEVFYINETFEDYASGSGVAVDIPGWTNKDIKASLFWQCRAYGGNQYAQISANNSKAENDVWLITKEIDLSDAISPEFTFEVTAGYYNADCLTIHVSENFNGSEGGISSATWTDVTESFTLPKGPASGYGTLETAGTMDFAAYAGKKVYIAFHYVGNGIDNSATTTFQIDNVKVSEMKVAMSVESVKRTYAVFQFASGKWSAAPSSIIIIQPEDYTAMGMNYLNPSVAHNYIPQFLAQKFPYAQEETVKTVVYKSSNTANYADEYTLTNGQWALNSFIVTKTDQFVYSGADVAGWVFDPTLSVTMQKGKNATDDYMMIVNYVIEHYEAANPELINSYRDTEYYYGFNANYGNISWRESDRLRDKTFAALNTTEEKQAYLTERTAEGLEIYLSLKFPNATPQVSGIDVFALVTGAIYDGVSTVNYTFKLQCTGANPSKWKFVEIVQ